MSESGWRQSSTCTQEYIDIHSLIPNRPVSWSRKQCKVLLQSCLHSEVAPYAENASKPATSFDLAASATQKHPVFANTQQPFRTTKDHGVENKAASLGLGDRRRVGEHEPRVMERKAETPPTFPGLKEEGLQRLLNKNLPIW